MKVIDKIKAKAKAKAPFFSFEFFPPKTDEGLRNLFSRVERLAGLSPVFIDVTWDASKPASNDKTLLICKVAQQYFGVDAMMHICLTSMSKAELRSVLTRAKEAGIENVLALRGDPPKGKEWKPVEDGLAYGADLIRFIRKEFGDHFCIACAGYPEGHMDNPDAEADLAHLKAKVDAGADFVMSQLFYDADLFLEFVKRCRNKGIECPILPGIMPIQSYRGFDRMTSYCKTKVPPKLWEALKPLRDDDAAVREFGIEVVTDICRKLLAAGTPGLHFYTLNLERAVRKILGRLELVSTYEMLSPRMRSELAKAPSASASSIASLAGTLGKAQIEFGDKLSLGPTAANAGSVVGSGASADAGKADITAKAQSAAARAAANASASGRSISGESTASAGGGAGGGVGSVPGGSGLHSSSRDLPWRRSTFGKRGEREGVRPIFWSNRPKSYLARTMSWDEFPNGRWGDNRSPAFGDLSDLHFYANTFSKQERVLQWGAAPQGVDEIYEVFARYVEGTVSSLPWQETPLQLETLAISEPLAAINRAGFLTINSQPRVNGVPSTDPSFGWGGAGGFCYQKAYLEFFCSPENLRKLMDYCGGNSKVAKSLQFFASDNEGNTYADKATTGATALTWGVFPNREILQPTVSDPDSFMVWKDEAFSLFDTWSSLYDEGSSSFDLVESVKHSYFLCTLIDHNFVGGDIFEPFYAIGALPRPSGGAAAGAGSQVSHADI